MKTQYIDTLGQVHFPTKMLGQGGQGMVMRTRDPDLAIKMVTTQDGEPVSAPQLVNRCRQRFDAVRLYALPENGHITVPQILLGDAPGYVMYLLNGFVSVADSLWPRATSHEKSIPTWLKSVFETSKKRGRELHHYSQSGSLRRRLQVCCHTAAELARLHARGLVYGDISANNIFVNAESTTVWLIDADNITYEREKGRIVVWTPGFGAPELVQEKSACTQATDSYSFAVLVYWMLTMDHPFLGIAAEDGSADWGPLMNDNAAATPKCGEDRAYAGELPWIEDPEDESNILEQPLLPRPLVFSPELHLLFQETFCAGRTEPSRRPVMWHWAEALARAADVTLACPSCGMSCCADYAREYGRCPYCSAELLPYLSIKSFRWLGSGVSPQLVWRFEHELLPEAPLSIPARVFRPFDTATAGVAPLLSVQRVEGGYQLELHEEAPMRIAVEGTDAGAFSDMALRTLLPASVTHFTIMYDTDFPYICEFTINQH